MSYTTVANVQADFKSVTFTASSFVTTDSVTQFILEADALINSYLGQRYVTPVTADDSSLALLSLYSRTLVSTRIRGILENKQATNIDANQNVKADGFSVKDVMAGLQMIQRNEMNLSGATPLEAGGVFFSQNQQSNVQPQFQRNTRQW